MKSVLFLSLLSLSSMAISATDWKVVAESMNNCKNKVQVLAKEGEKFVYVTDGSTKTKLLSEDGSVFSEQSGKEVIFTNANDKSLDSSATKYTFNQPSMVDGNPPKLKMDSEIAKDNCKMKMR